MALGLGIGAQLASSLVTTGLQDITSGSAAGLRLWLKNNTNVTASSWRDSSGYDNHVTQNTVEYQASVSGGGLDFESVGGSGGGDPVTDIDYYDLTQTIDIPDNAGFCVAMVVTRGSNTLGTVMIHDNSSRALQFKDATSFNIDTFDAFGTGSVVHTTAVFPENPFATGSKFLLLINRTSGANNKFSFFKNGSALTPDVDNSVNEAQGENPYNLNFQKFGSHRTHSTSKSFDGIIHEFALWNRSLNATEIADVNSFFTSYHGI